MAALFLFPLGKRLLSFFSLSPIYSLSFPWLRASPQPLSLGAFIVFAPPAPKVSAPRAAVSSARRHSGVRNPEEPSGAGGGLALLAFPREVQAAQGLDEAHRRTRGMRLGLEVQVSPKLKVWKFRPVISSSCGSSTGMSVFPYLPTFSSTLTMTCSLGQLLRILQGGPSR